MATLPGLSVWMISAGFHPYVGGAEKQALELSVALLARGVRVRVLTRRLPGLAAYEEVRGVPVERLWCAGGGFLNALTFMASLWLRLWTGAREYSAVHVHLAGSPALPAALAGRLLGKRVIIKLGGGRGIGELATSDRTVGGRLKLRLLSWLKPQFAAVTEGLAQECAQFLGPVPVQVQPNGVDTARYRPVSADEKRALRRKLGWPEGLGFLYVGRLAPEKQLGRFLSAWCRAAADRPGFAALVGDGLEGEELRTLARASPLAGRIFVLASMERIAEAYAAADVFVLPSVSEGLSNALLEAMASGLAVLGSRVGGTAEAVEEGKTGLLFAPQDADELADKLGRFLAEPGLAGRLGAAAREKAARDFSLERVAESYEKLYSR
ncbi:MAG: glycosyltransferase family 4 protein [Elusimicrobia bacterium]|nr:glycosyltransferase family 4 protein [Elusimicrobiota bacterium]